MDMIAITELMRSPLVIRIVSILDIGSLSILELLEYSLTLKDVNYVLANGVIRFDKRTMPLANEETTALGIPLSGDYYYNFLNSKVMLTEVGLYILDSIRSTQGEYARVTRPDDYSSGVGPRQAPGL